MKKDKILADPLGDKDEDEKRDYDDYGADDADDKESNDSWAAYKGKDLGENDYDNDPYEDDEVSKNQSKGAAKLIESAGLGGSSLGGGAAGQMGSGEIDEFQTQMYVNLKSKYDKLLGEGKE